MSGDDIGEDDIILSIVREQGCTIPASVKGLKDFDASLFFHICSVCLGVASKSQTGSADVASLASRVPQKLPPGKAAQFRVGTMLAEGMTKLGYTQEIGYESFLYPSEVGMKKLLRWLVGKLPKPESEGAAADEVAAGTATGAAAGVTPRDIKKVLQAWAAKKWTPHAYKGANMPRTYPLHSIPLSMPSTEAEESVKAYTAEHQPLVSMQPREGWRSAIPSLLAAHSLQLIRKERLLSESLDGSSVSASVEASARIKALTKGAFAAAMKEREKGLLAAGDDASRYSFGAGMGGSRSAFARRTDFENESSVPVVTGSTDKSAAASGQTEEEREAALKAERDAQLSALQSELDSILASIKSVDARQEELLGQSKQLEEDLAKLQQTSHDKEDGYLVKRRTLDLLPDAANNLVELQNLVNASRERLLALGGEWENYRQPLINKLRRARALLAERKAEVGSKIDAIKRLRVELKSKAQDLRDKEKLSKALAEELNALPKSVNRQVYVKRIMDLMKNISRQSAAIKSVLNDIRQLQKEINLASESSKRAFAIADEVIFSSAKRNPKDETMTKSYKYIVHLREGFVELVAGVEAKAKLETDARSIQALIDECETRNTNLNSERIEQDLAQVKKENKQLQAKIKAAQK